MESAKNKKDAYNKIYYEKNKNEWYKKIICNVCGGTYCRASKSNHFKSKKHIYADKDKQINELSEKNINMKELLEKEKKIQELTSILENIRKTLRVKI